MLASQLEDWLISARRRPLVMGVLNMTPDSFSDGGQFASPEVASEFALQMIDSGADWIDIGGESTRPGAMPVPAEVQIERIAPIIKLVRRKAEVVLSIDTNLWPVAQIAISAGANLVNDTSAGTDDPAMLPGVAAAGVPIILMHRPAPPATMQAHAHYADVTAEVSRFLVLRRTAAQNVGVAPHRILLDPGIGFGKTVDHNLTLLRDTAALAAMGNPLVIGASRKSFIGTVLHQPDSHRRIWGDAAIICWAAANGAAVVRVHDVEPLAQVLRMTCAVMANSHQGNPSGGREEAAPSGSKKDIEL